MGFTADTPTVAGIVLLRSAIQSPNYVTNVSGWTINQDGSVEFTNGVFRGTLSAGGGNVVVNAAGVHVQGALVQMDINSGAGFLVRALPNDGTAAQLTVIPGGGQLSLEPTPNPANPTAVLTQVFLLANTDVISGTDVQPWGRLKSPQINGLAVSTLQMWSQSSGSAVDNSKMMITTRDVSFSGYGVTTPHLGYGVIATGVMLSNGTAVTSGTQQTQTFATDFGGSSPGFAAGRAYRVEVTANVSTSVLHADPVFEVHKATPAGQRFGSWRVGPDVTGFPLVLSANCYFTVGAANITANILLTLGGAAGASVQVIATADNPTTITIYDCGPASMFPNAPILV